MSVVGCFFFRAEGGIRGFCQSRGVGGVYKRQVLGSQMRVDWVLSLVRTWLDEAQAARWKADVDTASAEGELDVPGPEHCGPPRFAIYPRPL